MTPVNYFLEINIIEGTRKALPQWQAYVFIISVPEYALRWTWPLNLYKQIFIVVEACGYTRNSLRRILHTLLFSTRLCMSVCCMRCSFVKKKECLDVLTYWSVGVEGGEKRN